VKVLVIEDDVKIAALLKRGLEQEGFAVELCGDGSDGLWRATEGRFDVIVLDILLPGLNGYVVCRRLRQADVWTPILMLTAKSGDLDEAEGLDNGADDYLSKPFSLTVLVARLRALLRRSACVIPDPLVIGDLRLNVRRRIVERAGIPIEFTAREFDVLNALARRRGEVLSKSDILEAVWDSAFDGDPNIVEVYVGRIRRKLGIATVTAGTVAASGFDPLIETVRGAGYRVSLDG
jgi:two-component system, OmpR family, response regulator